MEVGGRRVGGWRASLSSSAIVRGTRHQLGMRVFGHFLNTFWPLFGKILVNLWYQFWLIFGIILAAVPLS